MPEKPIKRNIKNKLQSDEGREFINEKYKI